MTKRGVSGSERALWSLMALAVLAACGTTQADLGGGERPGASPDGGSGGNANVPTVKQSNKLDLLLVVDNSISISPQQRNLATAVPDFVERVLNENPGFSDVHVGLVTTSLGGRGSDACPTTQPGERGEAAGDNGMLIGSRPRYRAAALRHPSAIPVAPEGYVQWTGTDSLDALGESVVAMVEAAGWQGCEFESPLEAMYRFLNDPEPPLEIVTERCTPANPNPCARTASVNDELLLQRRAFLRPDSAVAIALFTDENDCSFIANSQGYYLAREEITLPRATAECDANPNDPCCRSCISATPAGCKPDPFCSRQNGELADDRFAMRCFANKRRIGLDFLSPVARYASALTKPEICAGWNVVGTNESCSDGSPTTENPLFAAYGGFRRDPSMVYLLGVVGVPRADLLTDDGSAYRTAAELEAAGTWGKILGIPRPPNNAPPFPPTDALMIESEDARGGFDGQGVPLAAPAAGPLANPQNGHERQQPDSLQAACLVPLALPIDCSANAALPEPRPPCNCEGDPAATGLPECQHPETGAYDDIQRYDEAYPAPRQLELLRSLGDNGVTASLCARQFTDPYREDFGYREAAVALARQMNRSIR